jgi:hypothetical protein
MDESHLSATHTTNKIQQNTVAPRSSGPRNLVASQAPSGEPIIPEEP